MRQQHFAAAARPWALALCTAGALLGAPLAGAQGSTDSAGMQSVFQRERAACLNGLSHQDRTTCLKEASAAYQEARRGQMDNGEGVTSGSVNGGGIIR